MSLRKLFEQTETLTGAKMAQNAESLPHINMAPAAPQQMDLEPSDFTYIELKIAKHFVGIMGSKERAQRAIDMIGADIEVSIQDIADIIPDSQISNDMDISGLYNPSAVK
jgi:hypothetical protein